ncbi:plasma membrane proteolipid Pmp3 [Didymella glomerata]|uniref:Plasma membrane proteolipid Pmp3 n=1 Tax=Didymella glomerata TaxID=749621 RepID=A0A9W8X1M5_9PLEO|nr:plasma membrane proteolipid Pmp3 [Didymella glomerata]
MTTKATKSNLCLYFIAIFLPFLPVLLRRGCGADLLINICLDILGWIPGVVHSWWIISQSEVGPGSMGRADGRRPY